MSFRKILQQPDERVRNVDRDAAASSLSMGVVGARRVWSLKHLAVLLVLNACCLGLGLLIYRERLLAEGSFAVGDDFISVISRMPPALTAFLWIASLQGVLSFWVFRDLDRAFAQQQQQLADSMQTNADVLSKTRAAMIVGLSKLAEARNGDSEGHVDRVGIYSETLATAACRDPEFVAKVGPDFASVIRISAVLHDIGKVGIEDAILRKPGSLTPKERTRMQAHTRISSACLQSIEEHLGDSNFLQMAHDIALYHHERWDGDGYPTGLVGDSIPIAARIVAIADVYDALITRRIYKDAVAHADCVQMISDASGTQFDPMLVEVFLSVQDEFQRIASEQSVPLELDVVLIEVEHALSSMTVVASAVD